MSKIRTSLSINKEVNSDTELLAKAEFNSDRAFSMYVERVLKANADANRQKINKIKQSKKK